MLAVGGIMVDVDKETATKSLKDRQESNAMRLTIVEKQFDEMSKKETGSEEPDNRGSKGNEAGLDEEHRF